MAAGGGNPKIATPKHQRGQVVVGLGGRVQPIAVGRALDIRCPHGVECVLAKTAGARLAAVDIGRFVDKPVVETNLLEPRDHVGITTTQGLRLQFIDPFTQLPENLLQTFEKTLAPGIHLLDLALLQLVHGNTQTSQQQ
ncbi:hypothetical protein D3C80_993340 [compost metagenome]